MPDWLDRLALWVGYWTLAAFGIVTAWCMAVEAVRWWRRTVKPWLSWSAPRVTLVNPWHEQSRERMRAGLSDRGSV